MIPGTPSGRDKAINYSDSMITSVEIVPFNEVTAEFAATEGEGDGSLRYWREAHWAAFSRELALIKRKPAEDMPVVCERFELAFPQPAR